ncbi:MAG: hypothetical protein ACRELD_16735 [Longimicrobiales bacterium]
MKRMLAVAAALTLVGTVAPAAAQEPMEAQYIVTRSFQCSPQGGGVAWLQAWRPVVQEMIAEGRFLDYGILTHAWGDEWNVNDYFVVTDLDGFFGSFTELVRRVGERDLAPPMVENEEGEMVERRPFGQICTTHKDNIYAVVAAPSGG